MSSNRLSIGRQRIRLPLRRVALALLVTSTAAGCGMEAYESRMRVNTVAYLSHFAEVDAALGPEARGGIFAIRPLKGFSRTSGPKEKGARDPRLPEIFRLPLPGLVAAWKTDVNVAQIDEAPRPVGSPTSSAPLRMPAYCFLLSEDAIKATTLGADARFDMLVINRMLGTLGQATMTSRQVGDSLSRSTYSYGRFGRPKTFDEMSFEIEDPDTRLLMTVRVCLFRNRPKEAAVVFYYPSDISRSAQIVPRIQLCLASLESVGSAPVSTSSGGGGPTI